MHVMVGYVPCFRPSPLKTRMIYISFGRSKFVRRKRKASERCPIESMADSPEQEGSPSEVPVQAVADHTLFLEYLCRIIPALLEDRDSATATLKTSLVEKVHTECIKKFISDPQTPALLIQRSSTKGELYICEL